METCQRIFELSYRALTRSLLLITIKSVEWFKRCIRVPAALQRPLVCCGWNLRDVASEDLGSHAFAKSAALGEMSIYPLPMRKRQWRSTLDVLRVAC